MKPIGVESKADSNKEVKTYFSVVGRSLGVPGCKQIQGQHMGSMIVELLPSDKIKSVPVEV